jgi:hypothetical protein
MKSFGNTRKIGAKPWFCADLFIFSFVQTLGKQLRAVRKKLSRQHQIIRQERIVKRIFVRTRRKTAGILCVFQGLWAQLWRK